MKKYIAMMLCAGILTTGLVGCGNKDKPTDTTPTENATVTESSSVETEEDLNETEIEPIAPEAPELSKEMTAVREALIAALGDNYFPDMTLTADMVSETYGISADMYDDFFAETPSISTNVDSIVVVKAKADKVDDVKEALIDYQKSAQENLMTYPMNVGKIQGSVVEVVNDQYVVFAQLGGDTMDFETDEDVAKHCENENEKAIDAIETLLEEND